MSKRYEHPAPCYSPSTNAPAWTTSPRQSAVYPSTWLDRYALADYIHVRADQIAGLLKRGKLPTPSYHLGPRKPLYEREAVDRMIRGANNIVHAYSDPSAADPSTWVEALERDYAERKAKRKGKMLGKNRPPAAR